MNIFKLRYITTVLLIVGGVISCQCVPGLDTEKEITPSDYAKVLCINGIPKLDKVSIDAGNYKLHTALNYDLEEGYKYFNVPPGVINFYVSIRNDSVLFNGLANLSRGKAYTFLLYPLKTKNLERVQAILLYDTIGDFSKTNSYFRFVNISPESPTTLLFELKGDYPIPLGLGFRAFSKFLTVYPGSYTISVKNPENDSTIKILRNFPFAPGKGYTIIFRGYYNSDVPEIGSNLLVVPHNFDEIFEK